MFLSEERQDISVLYELWLGSEKWKKWAHGHGKGWDVWSQTLDEGFISGLVLVSLEREHKISREKQRKNIKKSIQSYSLILKSCHLHVVLLLYWNK